VAAPATCPGRTENTCPSLSHSLASADLVWVVDNTIVGNGRSGILIGAAGSTTVNEATIVNNVVAFNSLPGIQSYFPPGTIVGRRDEAYRNVGFGNPSGDFVEWVGGGIDYSRGNIVGDPLFVDRASHDYHLQDVPSTGLFPGTLRRRLRGRPAATGRCARHRTIRTLG
jgi:hypothetical protein